MTTKSLHQKFYALVGFLLVSGISPLPAIQIANFDSLTNDRFANDDSFVASQFDLSGVAFNGRWATMISPNVYITSDHYFPVEGSSMTFYASNDPNGNSATRQITSNRQQIGSTDIFVGTLDAALPTGFSFYDFATEDISSAAGGPGSFSQSIYNGANAYVFGRSTTSWPTSQNMAVGRNELDLFSSGQEVTNTDGTTNSGDAIGATDDRGTVDAVTYEAMLEVGDSGGPLFAENGEGGLTIVGVNWATGSDLFIASYLGNYDEDIQAFIDANPVPEPSSLLLLLSLAGGLGVLRRRAAGRPCAP